MLKPEIIELCVLAVFGPVIGAYLCLYTTVGDWVTDIAARPFGFLDGPSGAEPEPEYTRLSERFRNAA